MTTSAPDRVEQQLDDASLRSLLGLALDGGLPPGQADWAALLALAERERVVAVAWKRSATAIRRDAPAETSSRWHRKAVMLGLYAERQLELLATALGVLSEHGVDAVVLKGAPLAQRLYGDFTVRPSLDIDLWIPAAQRERSANALTIAGWRRTAGAAPEEETFEQHADSIAFRIEVHSSAIDDPLLDHLELPVEREPMRVAGHEIAAHSGRLLPAYLAAHLVKHHEKPLLWAIDFYSLWSSLGSREQADAMIAAREVGLVGHLRWAIELATNLDVARREPSRSDDALQRITRELATSSNAARVLRLMSLSSTPRAAVRVLGGRIWPRARRQGWRTAPQYFVNRAIRWSYRHLIFERPSVSSTGDASGRAISLASDDCEARLRELLQSSPAWIVPADGSMEPAIPAFATARVVPTGHRPLRVGDVVVVRGARGRCGLHRIASLSDGEVRVRADAPPREIQMASPSAIIGMCDLVEIGGQRVPIGERPYGSLGLTRAIIRSVFRSRGAAHAQRLVFARELGPVPPIEPSIPVEFRELATAETEANGSPVGSAVDLGTLEAGSVIGSVRDRQVYRVSYIRGDASALRDLPLNWGSGGRVLFFHDGFTDPEFRGRGIHTAALGWLMSREDAARSRWAIGVVDPDNRPAQRALRSLGFHVIGRVE